MQKEIGFVGIYGHGQEGLPVFSKHKVDFVPILRFNHRFWVKKWFLDFLY
jgi:hypothetical protein